MMGCLESFILCGVASIGVRVFSAFERVVPVLEIIYGHVVQNGGRLPSSQPEDCGEGRTGVDHILSCPAPEGLSADALSVGHADDGGSRLETGHELGHVDGEHRASPCLTSTHPEIKEPAACAGVVRPTELSL